MLYANKQSVTSVEGHN